VSRWGLWGWVGCEWSAAAAAAASTRPEVPLPGFEDLFRVVQSGQPPLGASCPSKLHRSSIHRKYGKLPPATTCRILGEVELRS